MAKVIRPGASAARKSLPAEQSRPVIRPAEFGGAENLVDADLEKIAEDFRDLEDDIEEKESELKALKKKLDAREAIIIERMTGAKMQSVQIKGRTLYLLEDLIVSKGKGVETPQLIEVLQEVGFGDIVGESYSAQTLKAMVKEGRTRAKEAKELVDGFDPTGEAWYCPACMTFITSHCEEMDNVQCHCQGDDTPSRCVRTINGVPARLSALLYQQEKTKLGSRKV